jgi:N-acetylneuraminate synthase
VTHPLFVAEISANHLGSLFRAHELIEAASEAGADFVKLQTYKPETMTLDLPSFSVSKGHKLWGGVNLFQLYREAMTPWEWHQELFEHARSLNLGIFSSPFDRSAVDFLEELDCSIYKIASLETGDTDLISYVASKGKPMIISTGATTLKELDVAFDAAKKTCDSITLLVCTSSYPADATDSHVKRITTLKKRYQVEVGLSDHTLGIGASIAAISIGATVIEKHLTIKRTDGGHDAAFSLEPEEFKLLVQEGRRAYVSLGRAEWSMQESEEESRRLRRSLFITRDVIQGEIATRENVMALRPNTGGPINEMKEILGKKFIADFPKGSRATKDCVEEI